MSKMMHDQPSAAVPASRDRRNFLIAGAGLALAATTLGRSGAVMAKPAGQDTPNFSYYNISAHNVVRDYVKNCPAKIKPRRAIFKIIPIMRNCIIRKTFFLGQFFSGTDRGRKNI